MLQRACDPAHTTIIGGSALRAAADEIIERGKRFAAHFMEADAADIAFADGQFTIAGTDRSMPIEQVARMSFSPVQPTFPNGCHVGEVEIDPKTGEATLDRYTVVDDIGTVINSLLAKGQIQGGVARGAGQALSEDVVYDAESGQLLTGIAAGTSNSPNVCLMRQKATLFQWLAVPLWFPQTKIVYRQIRDSGHSIRSTRSTKR